jgi:hypothetical protein
LGSLYLAFGKVNYLGHFSWIAAWGTCKELTWFKLMRKYGVKWHEPLQKNKIKCAETKGNWSRHISSSTLIKNKFLQRIQK